MKNDVWVLEVVRFIREKEGPEGWMAKGGKLEHVGYMKAKFKTKADACSYYDRYNPHMRSLNAHNTWESDWDPETNLQYIVRRDYGLIDNVPTFSPDEMPHNGEYTYLR